MAALTTLASALASALSKTATKFWLKAGGGLVKTYPPEAPLVLDVANKALEVITEGAGNIGVEITGYLAI